MPILIASPESTIPRTHQRHRRLQLTLGDSRDLFAQHRRIAARDLRTVAWAAHYEVVYKALDHVGASRTSSARGSISVEVGIETDIGQQMPTARSLFGPNDDLPPPPPRDRIALLQRARVAMKGPRLKLTPQLSSRSPASPSALPPG